MLKMSVAAACLVAAIVIPATAAQQAPQVVRKVLLQQDVPGNQQMSLVEVQIPAGGREGKHQHPGSLVVYVLEGNLTLDYEGKPTATYRPGDSVFIEANKTHEGINNGTAGIKAIATFVTEKGKPLTVQVQ